MRITWGVLFFFGAVAYFSSPLFANNRRLNCSSKNHRVISRKTLSFLNDSNAIEIEVKEVYSKTSDKARVTKALMATVMNQVNQYFTGLHRKLELTTVFESEAVEGLQYDSKEPAYKIFQKTPELSDKGKLSLLLIDFKDDEYCGEGDNIGSNKVILNRSKDCWEGVDSLSKTVAHEIGHMLGLQHTHINSGYPEAISRKEMRSDEKGCKSFGDGFCDTPADPDLSHDGALNNQCEYVGNAKDRFGIPYNPALRKSEHKNLETYPKPDSGNIMSYALDKCLTHFSTEQIQYMNSFIRIRSF